jgi:MoxR-like ATPase
MPEGSPVVLATDPDVEHDAEFSVILLDEIDKADPDVPNNLLVPLGSNEFTVTELGGIKVKATTPPLIFITTNDERELPAAFVRRCLVLTLERPSPERLVEIARAHFESTREDLYRPLADQVQEPASTAEYLDALRACIHLDVQPDPDDRVWREIMRATLHKERSAAIA